MRSSGRAGGLAYLIREGLELDRKAASGRGGSSTANKGHKPENLANQVQDLSSIRLRARYEDEGIDVAVYQCGYARSTQPPRWTSTQRVRR